jgi:hypothetical protein
VPDQFVLFIVVDSALSIELIDAAEKRWPRSFKMPRWPRSVETSRSALTACLLRQLTDQGDQFGVTLGVALPALTACTLSNSFIQGRARDGELCRSEGRL